MLFAILQEYQSSNVCVSAAEGVGRESEQSCWRRCGTRALGLSGGTPLVVPCLTGCWPGGLLHLNCSFLTCDSGIVKPALPQLAPLIADT